ncbi:hypothetical protein [Acidicapsa acidisoli]|uniref:hypothetical protein n=1 Tax=Acidicapsa acidisoli TaxID=1615681 RepID=UPI0021DF873F|nr:hypothetical protein [Acidicapsa acidisoli]
MPDLTNDEQLDDWDEPDWGELALREMGCFEEGSGDDDDPAVLAYMDEYADDWLEAHPPKPL